MTELDTDRLRTVSELLDRFADLLDEQEIETAELPELDDEAEEAVAQIVDN